MNTFPRIFGNTKVTPLPKTDPQTSNAQSGKESHPTAASKTLYERSIQVSSFDQLLTKAGAPRSKLVTLDKALDIGLAQIKEQLGPVPADGKAFATRPELALKTWIDERRSKVEPHTRDDSAPDLVFIQTLANFIDDLLPSEEAPVNFNLPPPRKAK